MNIFILLFYLYSVRGGRVGEQVWSPESHQVGEKERHHANYIKDLMMDVIKDTDEKIRAAESIRLDNFRSAAFEIGFLNYGIMEEYKKMLDKYNTSLSMDVQLYVFEQVMYLTDIEAHYWQIDHLANMQHEIERKYSITTGIKDFPAESEMYGSTTDPNARTRRVRRTKDRIGQQVQDMLDRLETTKKRSTRWWWPIEYGWEIEYYW